MNNDSLFAKISKLEKELLLMYPEYKNQLCYNVLKK